MQPHLPYLEYLINTNTLSNTRRGHELSHHVWERKELLGEYLKSELF